MEEVCKKFGVADPSGYTLATLNGVSLIASACLANYGLGSLFSSWQLKLIAMSMFIGIECGVVWFACVHVAV